MVHQISTSRVIYATPADVRRVILHFESYPEWNHCIPNAESHEDGSISVTDVFGTVGLCKIIRNDSSGFEIQFPGDEGTHWHYEFKDEGNMYCLLKLTIKSKFNWKQKMLACLFTPVFTWMVKMHLNEIANRVNCM